MADIVNLRESEYQSIVSELANMHSTQLQNISDIIGEIKTLVTSAETFSTNLITQNITDILDTLSTDAVSLLEQVFRDSEAGVASMITTTMAIDSAC